MKKNAIIIVVLAAAILLSVVAATSAESRSEYYGQIMTALDKLSYALQDKDKPAANVALGEVRVLTYSAMRYLAKIGEYDSRLMAVVDNANKAYTACFNGLSWEQYINEAYSFNYIVLAIDLPPVVEPSHS